MHHAKALVKSTRDISWSWGSQGGDMGLESVIGFKGLFCWPEDPLLAGERPGSGRSDERTHRKPSGQNRKADIVK